ncbi:LacI family DNA-binding transcriptional regulator [Streptomyces krungchingensis]
MAVTIADVAQAPGVGKTTVSRVLNTRGEVGRATAARVRQVIDRMGYVPSSGAVGLARGRSRSRTVGMLVPSLTWPWMGEVLRGVADTVEAADFGLLLFTCNRGADSVARFTGQVSARAFDGLLVVEPENTLDMLTALHRDGLPVLDDIPVARHTERTLSTVRRPMREMGETVARILLAHLEGQDWPLTPVVPPTTMIERRSAPVL